MGKQLPGQPNIPDRGEKEKRMSTIRWTKMEEKVGWSHGHYTVVNILRPSLRIERTQHHRNRDPSKKEREAFYRVILSFNLQVAIAGFDRGGRYQAFNRFFDNISLRYLFEDGEKHFFDPKADPIQSSLKVTNTEAHSQSLDAGFSGVTPATFAPKLEAHLNSEGTVVVEQESQKSWRSGLSFEGYHPPDRHHSHTHSYPKHEHHQHHYHSYSSGDIVSPVVIAAKPPYHPKHFTIKSPHADSCTCPPVISPHTCHLQDTGLVTYSKAAHWSWQARADIELWGPENYESMTRRITVARYICVDDVDPWIDQTIPDYTKEKEQKRVRPFLHFDFILESRLRELDHGWNGFKNAFRRLPKPPETRRKADSGLPLRRDKVAFCVSPCYEMVSWPFYKTRNFAKEAWLIMNGDIKSRDNKILPDDEYLKQKKETKEQEEEKEKKGTKNNCSNGCNNNSGARCSCCPCEGRPGRSPSRSSISSVDEYYGHGHHHQHHYHHHIHRGPGSRSSSRSHSPRPGIVPEEHGSLPPSRRASRLQEELEHEHHRPVKLEEALLRLRVQAEAQEQAQTLTQQDSNEDEEEKSSASEDSDVVIKNFDRRKEAARQKRHQQHQRQQEERPTISAPTVIPVVRIQRLHHGHRHGHGHGNYRHQHHHHRHPRSPSSSISTPSWSRTPSPSPAPRPDRGPRDGSPSADGGERIHILVRSSSRVRDQRPGRSPSPRRTTNRSPSPRPNPRPGRSRVHARYDSPIPYPSRQHHRVHGRVRSPSRERTRSQSRNPSRDRV